MQYIAGIDPGIDGGVALLLDDGKLYEYCKMPTKPGHSKSLEVDVVALRNFLCRPARVYIELVGPIPKAKAKSSFSFGRNFQAVLDVCQLAGHSYELVPPKVWQEIHKGRYKGKLSTLAMVNRLWPGLDITHDGQADSIGIALWGHRQFFSGKSSQPLESASDFS